MIHPVILCGGTGTRLWPASRRSYPKQFAPLLGGESPYEATLRRFTDARFAEPLVMTGEAFRFLAVQQAARAGLIDARIVIEPCLRDTAPAVLAAALMLAEGAAPEALMLVAPADHALRDLPAFLAALDRGAAAAKTGALVTFGVAPDRAETGYGYLELAAPPDGTGAALPVASFREKPDAATAEAFLAGGRHLWNAGLFLGRAMDVIAAFETHAPDLLAPCRSALAHGTEDLSLFRLDPAAWRRSRAVSFDYAVMEKAAGTVTVPLGCGWSDLGSWEALRREAGPDAAGLATEGTVTALDCRDSYLRSDEEGVRLVGLGLENIVAVAMRDAVLVADRRRVQEIRELVPVLRDAGVAQADAYPRYHRPWGWYETLCLDRRFQVKRIMVHPGGVLSLQSHLHRAEHWVVVSGTAEVTIGNDRRLVSENQSVYIPLGVRHRMSNPGRVPMYLIEVQTGAYLGEDDIQRHEDAYGRP